MFIYMANVEEKENQICECGHKESNHLVNPKTKERTNCYFDGTNETCPCKKFKVNAGTLSDKVFHYDPSYEDNVIPLKDVKESIKRLKVQVWANLDKNRETWYKTDNSEIANQRMMITNLHQSFIDEINKIFEDKLT